MSVGAKEGESSPAQTLNRRLRDLRNISSRLETSAMTPLQTCEAIIQGRVTDDAVRNFFSGLPQDERHYWVASLYALLMPKGRRRRLAAYFTPPPLAQHAIETIIAAGVEPGRHRILDPASGGAAFLVPLAHRIAHDLNLQGARAQSVLEAVESSLAGIEIEPRLAQLSQILLSNLLGEQIAEAGRTLQMPVRRTNALKFPAQEPLFDAVIGNPPYGRIFRPSKKLLSRFAPVVTDGYVNLYALFIEQALRWVRAGGVVCLIVPMSFIGGAYFSALRKRILEKAEVLRLDPIDKRSDVFMDVLYDVCVLALRKKGSSGPAVQTTSSLLLIGEPPRPLGLPDIPEEPSERLWALPDGLSDDKLFHENLATLRDYGYIAKTGYFVWNREQDRYRAGFKPRTYEVPLYWAHNIEANSLCEPCDGDTDGPRIGIVKIASDSPAIVRTDAIILQRTTNRRQKRRLIAGIIRKAKVPGRRGFVSENHTILILPDPAVPQRLPIRLLCRLLNTKAVDMRFRRVSGSVSVSTKGLRQLPLPSADSVRSAFLAGMSDDDAAELAYAISLGGTALPLPSPDGTPTGGA